jgi:hypothetical protein
MNIFIVITNGHGNVVDSKSICSDDYKNFAELNAAVNKEHETMKNKYSDAKYNIHVSVGDSLISVLRSFPEIRTPKTPVQK